MCSPGKPTNNRHVYELFQNFFDDTLCIACSCGWRTIKSRYPAGDYKPELLDAWQDHVKAQVEVEGGGVTQRILDI